MERIRELLEKRARKITEARACMDQIKDDTPEERAADLQRQFDGFMSEAQDLQKRADRLQQLADAEASLEQGDPRRPNGDGEHRNQQPGKPMEYRDAFHQLLMAGGDIHAMSAEARAALQGGAVQQAMSAMSDEQRAQIAGTAAAGGHLVPDESNTKIIKAMEDWGPMFSDDFGTVIKTDGGGAFPIPGLDDTAGRAAKTATEGDPLADTGTKDVAFTKTDLGDFMYDTEWLKVSIQLMTGAFTNVEDLLASLLGERLGRTANEVLTVGTGASEPLGIVPGASVGLNATGAAAVTADEIQELFHSVNSAYRRSPKFGFMFNDNTLLKLHGLKDGQGNYLLSAAPGAEQVLRIGAVKAKYTINDSMADLGANNRSMIAGDMSKYFVRKVGKVMIVTARDSKFLPGFGIAGFARFDGAVADTKAIKALVHPAA